MDASQFNTNVASKEERKRARARRVEARNASAAPRRNQAP